MKMLRNHSSTCGNFLRVFVLLGLFILSQCKSEKKTVLSSDTKTLVVSINNLEATDPTNFKIYLIDENDELVELMGATYDPERGLFTAPFRSNQLTDLSNPSELEKYIPPLIKEVSSSYLDGNRNRFRIAIGSETVGQTTSIAKFGQFFVNISEQDKLSDDSIIANRRIGLEEVGMPAVLVRDLLSGNPVENAKVAIFSSNTILENENQVPIWTVDYFRPIIIRTNAQGLATGRPVSIKAEDSAFQILAYADGYCSHFSATNRFSTDTPTYSIELLPCSEDQQTYKLAFDASEAIFTDNLESSEQEFLYTNTSSASLRIDTRFPYYGQLKLLTTEVTENDLNRDIKIAAEQIIQPMNGPISARIPIIFDTTGTENGVFAIQVQDVNNENKTSNRLYGRKQTFSPNLLFTDTLALKSSQGVDNILSGKAGIMFNISSNACIEGAELGVAEAGSAPTFKPCVLNQASFDPSELALSTSESQLTVELSLEFYIKDRYKNISNDDPTDLHTRQITVDYGAPRLSTNSIQLQVSIGIIETSTAATGTVDNPYNFALGELDGLETDTVILSGATLSNFKIGFSSPSFCITESYEGDGLANLEASRAVHRFRISSQNDIATGLESLCQANNAAQTIDLSSDIITFPSEQTEPLSIYLFVIDAAGNESEGFSIEVPSCTGNERTTPGTPICWEP